MNAVAINPASKHRTNAAAGRLAPRVRQRTIASPQLVVLTRDLDGHRRTVGRTNLRWEREMGIVTLSTEHLEAGVTCRAGRLALQIPPNHQPVAPFASVQRVRHLTVQVGQEAIRRWRPSLVRLKWALRESSGSNVQRTTRDALVQALRLLSELERVADPLVPPIRERRQHVRMGVEAVVGLDARPTQDVADQLVAVERPLRGVPAVAERPDHLAGQQLVLSPTWRS